MGASPGGHCVTVEADATCVERRLKTGEPVCPSFGGVLTSWGFGRAWRLCGLGGRVLEVRPRRSRCSSCEQTHVLLPVCGWLRRFSSRTERLRAAFTTLLVRRRAGDRRPGNNGTNGQWR
ncbi:hypothetical protein [Nonomuraea turcica]|uniref:hypothetical protein n=1 Tax=Nonomuraea sp. G32 TaxID=3067274 RepID=UPI00273BF4AB|nr:hypothetical protein [Nonomuraea sp. G32]MDP4511869.1 hypothetical protein [Nonomuraea sp. G32]